MIGAVTSAVATIISSNGINVIDTVFNSALFRLCFIIFSLIFIIVSVVSIVKDLIKGKNN